LPECGSKTPSTSVDRPSVCLLDSLAMVTPGSGLKNFMIGVKVIVVLATLSTLVALTLSVIAFTKNPYNEERIAPAIARAHGLKLYQKEITGPLLCLVYGPNFYLLYLPAALFRHVTQTLVFGTLWSLICYNLPILYYVIADSRASLVKRAIPVISFITLSLASYWGTHVMLAVHPDAAACGMAGLGLCVIASAERLTLPRVASGVFLCVAAIGCKQNAACALLFLFTIVWWRGGRKWVGNTLLCSIIAVTILLLVFRFFNGDLDGIWFNNYVVPMRIGLVSSKWTAAALSCYQSMVMPLILVAIIMSNDVCRDRFKEWKPQVAAFAIALVVTSVLLSFPAYLIYGGVGNAFAPAIYSMILLPTLWLRSLLLRCSGKDLALTAFGPVAFLCLVAFSTMSLAVRTPELKTTLRRGPSAVVEEYSRHHPGEIYFPFNPVAVYDAGGQFYHSDWGLADRGLAGLAATEEQFLADIPKAARFIAYPIPPGTGPGYVLDKYYPGLRQVQLSELAEFSVYALR